MAVDLHMDRTPEWCLATYLLDAYKSNQLRILLSRSVRFRVVDAHLPEGSPSSWETFNSVVDELRRHGLIDVQLFELLMQDRPAREREIRSIAGLFDVALPGSCDTPTQASRLGEVFYAWSLSREQPLPRRLKARRSAEIDDISLLDQGSPGLDVIVGEAGLGCTTALYRLALAALRKHTSFICLSGAVDLGSALAQGDREWSSVTGSTDRGTSLVLWDDCPLDCERQIGPARLARSDLRVVASCERSVANSFSSARIWDLLPLRDEERRTLLEQNGLPAELLDTWKAWLREGADDILGNPLFIKLAATTEGDVLSPQLTQLIVRQVTSAVEQHSNHGRALGSYLVAISEAWIVRQSHRLSLSDLRDLFIPFEDSERLGLFEDALGHLASTGTLMETAHRWYAFRHDLYPLVIAAQERGQRRDLRRADGESEGAPRRCAILVPAFSDLAIPALDVVAPHQDELWLQGLSELAHEVVGAEALEGAFRRYLPFDDPTKLLTSITSLFHAPDMLGTSKAVGLLRGLVYMDSRDPDLLGVLLMVIDHWKEQGIRSAEPLRREMLRRLPRPETSGPFHILQQGRGQVRLARYPVTWDEFEAVFPGRLAFPWSGVRAHRPRTAVRWPTARLFAALVGGRLPTREEWKSAHNAVGWPSVSAPCGRRVAHLAYTHSRLERDGPGPVDDARLSEDPGRGRLDQLVGNVREWTEDPLRPESAHRWTLGGSYQTQTAEDLPQAWYEHRVDLGFRVCWDVLP